MSDLRDLYQEIIIDHGRRPRNCKCMENANHKADGYNPLCGDKLTLYLRIEKETVVDATFEGVGCAISTASASLMTEAIKGKSVALVESLFHKFHQMLTEDVEVRDMGKLETLAGVREYPNRVKCATLAWHTLIAALEDRQTPITTE